jgi:hypothetical protein
MRVLGQMLTKTVELILVRNHPQGDRVIVGFMFMVFNATFNNILVIS